MDPEQRDAFGIVVSYSVKVKLYLGALSGELVAELPFILMHPKVSLRQLIAALTDTWQLIIDYCALQMLKSQYGC